MKNLLILGVIGLSSLIFLGLIINLKPHEAIKQIIRGMPTSAATPTPEPPTATPTKRPLTLAEMNQLYGPCAKIPVLMYHHIQEMEIAKASNQQSLTVTPEWLAQQMQYLKEKGYTVIPLSDIVAFFDDSKPLPKKPVAVTLDDAYEDNYLYAWNIFKEFGTKATIFTPTGLVTVPDYLNWNEIKEMADSGLINFANHTWSHHSSAGSLELQDKEISLADGQLAEKGLNQVKTFAYPYGAPSKDAQEILKKYNYKLAFTTVPGSILCKAKRFELPRVRAGNMQLNRLGL